MAPQRKATRMPPAVAAICGVPPASREADCIDIRATKSAVPAAPATCLDGADDGAAMTVEPCRQRAEAGGEQRGEHQRKTDAERNRGGQQPEEQGISVHQGHRPEDDADDDRAGNEQNGGAAPVVKAADQGGAKAHTKPPGSSSRPVCSRRPGRCGRRRGSRSRATAPRSMYRH
jgi:hypothetical protein